MAWTQTDLDVLEAAMVSGQRRVRLNGREVEYHSVDQMIKARDLMRSELNRDSGVARRPTTYRARTSKGL